MAVHVGSANEATIGEKQEQVLQQRGIAQSEALPHPGVLQRGGSIAPPEQHALPERDPPFAKAAGMVVEDPAARPAIGRRTRRHGSSLWWATCGSVREPLSKITAWLGAGQRLREPLSKITAMAGSRATATKRLVAAP